MLKAKELRDQTKEELEALVIDKRKELFELKNKRAREKKTDSPQQGKNVRKEIARILTVLKQKEIATQEVT